MKFQPLRLELNVSYKNAHVIAERNAANGIEITVAARRKSRVTTIEKDPTLTIPLTPKHTLDNVSLTNLVRFLNSEKKRTSP